MYDGAYAARDHGVSLAFITSNEIYWQVRYEASADGRPRRTTGRNRTRTSSPTRSRTRLCARSSGATSGGRSSSSPASSCRRTASSIGAACRSSPSTRAAGRSGGRICEAGVRVPGELVGYEIDSFILRDPAPDAVWRELLAASPFVNFAGKGGYVHNMSIYLSPLRVRWYGRRARWTGRGRLHREEAATARTTMSGPRSSGSPRTSCGGCCTGAAESRSRGGVSPGRLMAYEPDGADAAAGPAASGLPCRSGDGWTSARIALLISVMVLALLVGLLIGYVTGGSGRRHAPRSSRSRRTRATPRR